MVNKNKKKLILISGPTAIGKTNTSIQIAKYLRTEIISCDSRQFFKELKIGSAPPSDEELTEVPHHFIQHLSIKQEYNAGQFEKDAIIRIEELFENHDKLILVGGSGLYINAICDGLDYIPQIDSNIRNRIKTEYTEKGLNWLQKEVKEKDPLYFKTVDKKNPQRLMRALEVFESHGKELSSYRTYKNKKRSFETIKIGLSMERSLLYKRINNRVETMMKKGLLEEVKSLIKYQEKNALQTVGYKELFSYLKKQYTLDDAIELIKRNTRRFAKRQITWFKKEKNIKWFLPKEIELIKRFIEQ